MNYLQTISPSGKRLITIEQSNHVVVRDAQTRGKICRFKETASRPSVFAFGPDDRTITMLGDRNEISVYDATTGKQFHSFTDRSMKVALIRFSADGRLVAALSNDATRLWDATTGMALQKFQSPFGSASSIAFRADGKRLACGYPDGHVVLWNLHTGENPILPKSHEAPIEEIVFSSDGTLVGTVCRRSGDFRHPELRLVMHEEDAIPIVAFDDLPRTDGPASVRKRPILGFDLGLIDPADGSFVVVYSTGMFLAAMKPRTVLWAASDTDAPVTSLTVYAQKAGTERPTPFLTFRWQHDIRGHRLTLRFKDTNDPNSLIVECQASEPGSFAETA